MESLGYESELSLRSLGYEAMWGLKFLWSGLESLGCKSESSLGSLHCQTESILKSLWHMSIGSLGCESAWRLLSPRGLSRMPVQDKSRSSVIMLVVWPSPQLI